MKETIFQISDGIKNIIQKMEEVENLEQEGREAPTDYDSLIEELQKSTEKMDMKVDSICSYVRHCLTQAEVSKQEIARIDSIKKYRESKAKSLTYLLNKLMVINNFDKYDTPKNKLSFRKSTSTEIYQTEGVPCSSKRSTLQLSEYQTNFILNELNKLYLANKDLFGEGINVEVAPIIMKDDIKAIITKESNENKDLSIPELIKKSKGSSFFCKDGKMYNHDGIVLAELVQKNNLQIK